MSQRYKSTNFLFNDPNHSNVKFNFNDQQNSELLYAHREVLEEECPQLYAIIKDLQLRTIKITEDDFESFRKFLRYLYLGRCKNVTKYFCRLIKIARKYDHQKFEEYLIEMAMKNINVKIAAPLLEASLKRSPEDVVNRIMEEIQKRYTAVIKSKSFLEVNKATVEKILESDRVDAGFPGEHIVYDALMRYAVLHDNLDPAFHFHGAIRMNWWVALRLVRFGTMTMEVFHKCVWSYPSRLGMEDHERKEIENTINGIPPDPPFICVFSSTPRIPLEIASDNELVIGSQFNASGTYPKKIMTTFYVNKRVLLKQIGVTRSSTDILPIQLELIDRNGSSLASVTTGNIQKFEPKLPKLYIEIRPQGVELQPFNKYSIRIDHQFTHGIKKNFGVSKQRSIRNKNVTFHFDSINPGVHGFEYDVL